MEEVEDDVGDDAVVFLQIVDRQNEPTNGPFFSGWEARRLLVATVTSDSDTSKHSSRISFRGSDTLSKVQNVTSILLGGDASREKTFVLGSTPVLKNSLAWVCYWGPPRARAAASSCSTCLKCFASGMKCFASDSAGRYEEGGGPALASTTGAAGAPGSAAGLFVPNCDSEPGATTAKTTGAVDMVVGNGANVQEPDYDQHHDEQDFRVRLLDASGCGYTVTVNINETTTGSFPLTIPSSLPIFEAETILRESVFGGQEVRLLPVELESEMESEEGVCSPSADQKMDTGAHGAARTGQEGDDEKKDQAEGSGGDDVGAAANAEAGCGPLVSSLIPVDRHTGARRPEVALGFPPAPESDSELGDDGDSQDLGLAESSSDDSHSSSSEEEEEEGAPHTTKSIVRSLERAISGEGRPGVFECVLDLPAAPLVHVQKSGHEYALTGGSRSSKRSDIDTQQSADDLASEQRARLGLLLDEMKCVDRYPLLNELGDAILRPGLFTISNQAEQVSWFGRRPGDLAVYKWEIDQKRRVSFCKSLSGNQVAVTTAGIDITQHLISQNLPGRIQAELETGYPVEIQFERLDAGGCCSYMDKLRDEEAEKRRIAIQEDKKRAEKRAKELKECPDGGRGLGRGWARALGLRSFCEPDTSNSGADDAAEGRGVGPGPGNAHDSSTVGRGEDPQRIGVPVAGADPAEVAIDPALFEGEHSALDPPDQHDVGTTGQASASSSSSSSGGPGADAVLLASHSQQEIKSDDEDAAYERISRDVFSGCAVGERRTPIASAYEDPIVELKHPKYPGRRWTDENTFNPRIGRWRALLTEDDADVLRRRDDERGRTIGTLLVSVQGPWTESSVSSKVTGGGVAKNITLVKRPEASHARDQHSRGHEVQVRCAAIIRGLDVEEPAGLGIGAGDDFQRGHAFVLVYRLVRPRRVPIVDRQKILTKILHVDGRLPPQPGREPVFREQGRVEWLAQKHQYETAIKKKVRRAELEALWSQKGFTGDTKMVRRDEKWRFRNKRWLHHGRAPKEQQYADAELSAAECNRLGRRLAVVLRSAWASREFMHMGGEILLPHYGVYGPRELHPLRSDSLAKPLQRGLPDFGPARALAYAAKCGIAKQSRPVKAFEDRSATAVSPGAAEFFCYESVETFYEPRLCLTGTYSGCSARGHDLAFREQLPPFRFRSRHPDDADVFGNGAAAAALIIGGPLAFAAEEKDGVVPTEEHSRVDEISESSYPDPDHERAVRDVRSFSEKLVQLTGVATTAEDGDSTAALTQAAASGEVYWLRSEDLGIKTLTGTETDFQLEDNSKKFRVSAGASEFAADQDSPGGVGHYIDVDSSKTTEEDCSSIALGLAGVFKLVVPPYDERGFCPVDLSSATPSRTLIGHLFEIDGGDCATQAEYFARNQSELRNLERFLRAKVCRSVFAEVSPPQTHLDAEVSVARPDLRHRSPLEVRCETLDRLSWFWSKSKGFRPGRSGGIGVLRRDSSSKKPAGDDAGSSADEQSSADERGVKSLPSYALINLIGGHNHLAHDHGEATPHFLEDSCSSAMARARLGDVLRAGEFCWTLVFPSRGVHPTNHYRGPGNFADRMRAYRGLLRRAALAAPSGPGAEATQQPLELLLSPHWKDRELLEEFKAVAPLSDLQLVHAAHEAGGIVKLRWYLQELASYPQRDLPSADAAKSIGAETAVDTYVLQAAPVSNPLATDAGRSVPIRELAIDHGTEAFRPRRALAVRKPLPSNHLQPIKRDGSGLTETLPVSNTAGSSCSGSSVMTNVDANAESTTSSVRQQPQPTFPGDDVETSQLEFIAGAKGRAGFSSKEDLRQFLFKEVGPQYDCIATEDIWVAPLPSKLKWPSRYDLNKQYREPYEWRARAVGKVKGKTKAAEAPSKAERAKHKEDWERREDLRTRKKVRRAKANLIYFPLAKQNTPESAVGPEARASAGNLTTTCGSNTAPRKTSASSSECVAVGRSSSSSARASGNPDDTATTVAAHVRESARDGDDASLTTRTDFYSGFYLCAAFHITFPPSDTRWAPPVKGGAAAAKSKSSSTRADSATSSGSAAACGKRRRAMEATSGEAPSAEEGGGLRKRSRTMTDE